MLKLILGRAGSGKTTAVYRRMCGAGAERPQVLLVPEQNSHEAERALCKVGGTEYPCMRRCSPSAAWPTGSFWRPEGWEKRSWTQAAACC